MFVRIKKIKFSQQTPGKVFNQITDLIIAPSQAKDGILQIICLAALCLLGMFLLGRFLNWGQTGFTFHDWADITGPRLSFLQDAMRKLVLPLHSLNFFEPEGITTRYMAIPDAILSPQIALLRYLSPEQFSIFQVLFMYTFGFWGLLRIRRRFSLSLFSFAILYFLYNFNGHILGHLAVGHLTWAGYFLYAWFALLIFDFLDGQTTWTWITRLSLLLFAILLQGSYHQFVWCLFFLGFLVFARPDKFFFLFKTVIFTGLVSLVRLLPPVILMGDFKTEFHGGYPHVLSLVDSLVNIQLPGDVTTFNGLVTGLGLWETTLFVGLTGAVFLLFFGFYRWFSPTKEQSNYQVIFLPVMGLILLSMDRIFEFLRSKIPFPLLSGERVASRIISLAFVFVLVLAVIQFQSWLTSPQRTRLSIWVCTVASALGLLDLWQNYKTWQVELIAESYKAKEFIPTQFAVNNHTDDEPYMIMLGIGLAVSSLSIGYLVWKCVVEKRKSAVALPKK